MKKIEKTKVILAECDLSVNLNLTGGDRYGKRFTNRRKIREALLKS